MWETQFDPWVRKIPWRRAWQPPPVFLRGESSWTGEPGGVHGVAKSQTRPSDTHTELLSMPRWLSSLLCHSHEELLRFPACLPPRVRQLFSLSLSPQIRSHLISFFLSLLVGWLWHSLRSYPHYFEAFGDPIPLLDPTTGACGEPCSPSPVTYLWLELHGQVPGSACLSSTPGFAGSRHLLQNSLLEKRPRSGKTLHQKDAHAVEKIMVHHYQNIACHHGNTEVEAPKTRFPLRPATLVCSQSIPSSSEHCFLKP